MLSSVWVMPLKIKGKDIGLYHSYAAKVVLVLPFFVPSFLVSLLIYSVHIELGSSEQSIGNYRT